VACYISFGDEPSTNIFLRHCQYDERIDLYVPRVQGDDLEWVQFSEDQAKHPLGMNEPLGTSVNLTEIDLMVIPALAADHAGHRLGRGKGFYDRALQQISAKKIVVLVHDDEIFDSIPFESHDVLVQVICGCSEIVSV
jgi:5-formyltetrahydrofolate cyclo-ligase